MNVPADLEARQAAATAAWSAAVDAPVTPTDCGHPVCRDRMTPLLVRLAYWKQVLCKGCGQPVAYQHVFEETYCGWNSRYMDGRAKSPETIQADLEARAARWNPLPWCEWCLVQGDLQAEVRWSEAMLPHAVTDQERARYVARAEHFRARLSQHQATRARDAEGNASVPSKD